MAVTISDVANAAGVSASTVSRALTRPERVDPQTRARIFMQIERLGYKVNRAARGLATGRTGNLAVIVSDLGDPVYPDIVKGVQRRAHAHDRTTLLADSEDDPRVELDLLGALAPQVDGIIVCGSRASDDALRQARELVPLVLVSRRAPGVPGVVVDNANGMRRAVRHLWALRHRRIGYVGGPAARWPERDRLATARATATEIGMELVEFGNVMPLFAGGAGVADHVLLAEVSAVLAFNDVIAIGLMHQLVGYGVSVPDDISVLGFDDISLAEIACPPLTTVRFPRQQLGAAAVDRLLADLDGAPPEADSGPSLTTELVVRRSTTRLNALTEANRV